MVAHINTVAFLGLEARPVEVQVQMSGGLPALTIVGLPDKAVAESRERVRAATWPRRYPTGALHRKRGKVRRIASFLRGIRR